MSSATLYVGASIGEFLSATRQMQTQLKTIDATLKANTATIGTAEDRLKSYQTAQTTLAAKVDTLTGLINTQTAAEEKHVQRQTEIAAKLEKTQAEIDKYKAAIEVSTKTTGANSQQTLELQQKLSGLEKQQANNQKAFNTQSVKAEECRTKIVTYNATLKETQDELEAVNSKIKSFAVDELVTKLNSVGDAAGSIGYSLTRNVTTGLVSLGKSAVETAISFEDAFASVRKTVDATDEQLDNLKEGAIELSKTSPVTAETIMEIEALGGQLGIATENLQTFAQVVSGLTIATDLDADTAATDLAQFANLTGMSEDAASNFGSALVELGNTSATTESAIIAMAMRLAAAGTQAGMSQSDILGLSAALSSVGITAEAGGTAISTILSNIGVAVATNSEDLETWAQTAGMSTAEFTRAWQTDAAGTFQQIIQGMQDTQTEGGNLTVLLNDLGVTSITQSDSIKRLASSGDLLTDSISTASQAWTNDIALQNEVDAKNDTTSAKIQTLKNSLTALGDNLGQYVLPVIQKLVDFGQRVIDKIDGMDEGSQKLVLAIGGITAAAGPLLVVFSKIFGSNGIISGAMSAFGEGGVLSGLGSSLSGVFGSGGIFSSMGSALSSASIGANGLSGAFTGLLSAVNPVVLVIGAIVGALVLAYQHSASFRIGVGELVDKLGSLWDVLTNSIGAALEGLREPMASITDAFGSFGDSAGSIFGYIGDLLAHTVLPVLSDFLSWLTGTIAEVIVAAKPLISGIGYLFAFVSTIVAAVVALFDGDLSGAWERIKQAGSDLVNAITGIFTGLGSMIGQLLDNIITGISDWLNDLFLKGAEVVSTLWDGFLSKVSEFSTNVQNWVDGIVQSVGEWLSGIRDKGVNAVKDLWHGYWSMYAWLGDQIWGFVSGILSSIGDWFSGIYDTGVAIVEGLWNGIWEKIDWLKQKIKDFAGDVVSFFTGSDALDINSPSRVMRDKVGVYIAYGIGEGITKGTPAVIDAVKASNAQIMAAYDGVDFTAGASIGLAAQAQQADPVKIRGTADGAEETRDSVSAAYTDMTETATEQTAVFSAETAEDFQNAQDAAILSASQMKTQTLSHVTELVTNVRTRISSLPSLFYTVGNQALAELQAGIESQRAAVLNTASDIVNALVSTFQTGLGIHSPSRVMRDFIGRNMIAGLLLGLKDDELVTFAAGTVQHLRDAYSAGNLSIGTLVNTLDDDGVLELIDYLNSQNGSTITTSVYPLDDYYEITSGWGYRDASETNGIGSTDHGGADIGAPAGEGIRASLAGTVTQAGWYGGYGNAVIIDHGSGLQTLYGHMSSVAASVGQQVNAGDRIGYVGTTGNSTGNHLHFEVRQDGTAIDPTPYLNGTAVAGDTLAVAIQAALRLKQQGMTADQINALGSSLTSSSGVWTGSDLPDAATLLGWVRTACAITGEPDSSAEYLIYAIMRESGGDPNAINDWDSNAAAGTPSKGLLQVIDPTFAAYKLDGYDNIYDPVSNIIAAIRYMRARYGSVINTISPRMGGWYGYSVGSRYITSDQLAQIHEGELIIPRNENPYRNSGGLILQPLIRKVLDDKSRADAQAIVSALNGTPGSAQTGDSYYNFKIDMSGQNLTEREAARQIVKAFETQLAATP